MEFTKEQQQAIDIRDKNILVSAAAGSGKTAVLVNRIINRVLDAENPVDIDRILVMTFTKAAAAQMKEKILSAIEEKRAQDPFNKNLLKQAALVHGANITTIDSFCLGVVRNHFAEIDLNPDFRMADEGECNLMKQDVLEKVFEKYYETSDEEFLNMTETFATKKSDDSIGDIILKLHSFSLSYPDPDEFLKNCIDAYQIDEKTNIDDLIFVKEYVREFKKMLKNVRRLLDRAADLCMDSLGPMPYLKAFEDDIKLVDSLLSIHSYSEIQSYLEEIGGISYMKMPAYRLPKEGDVSIDELERRTELRDKVKAVREKTKKLIDGFAKFIEENSEEEIRSGIKFMAPHVHALIDITMAFGKEYSSHKREKNVVDFSDLEHMCLEILRTSESATKEYRQFFEEIYVDEYQDSNLIQEELLKYLCKPEGDNGNLFMVGDVKQSIYGFRLARPEIFIDKYNRFESYELADNDVKIDLHDNFRSRNTVIDSVNDIFKYVMTEESGSIIYDENAALHAKALYPNGNGFETELIITEKDDDVKDRELEARSVGKRICELVGRFDVTGEDGELRKAKYSDIVILLRTTKDWDNVFMHTLSDMGIPVHVTQTSGYFSQTEVATLLEFLKVIDNPLQDIPLMATLRSVIGGFYDEEVARIRGAYNEGYLYDAMLRFYETYKQNSEYAEITEKINSFINELNYYRRKTSYTSVDLIISEIIDGYYGDCIVASENGKKKYANLNILLQKAVDYGKTSYKGLFHFNRYIELLHKYEVDFGEANVLDEKDDAVRIMSIHKSKGLEFPVCFICGMNKKFNVRDTSDVIIPDVDRGIAVDVIDPVKRTKKKSMIKASLAYKKRNEILAEEMRLFYVAMTRAKEKLIMTAVCKGYDISEQIILQNAKTYLDLYTYANQQEEINCIKLIANTVNDLVDDEVKRNITGEINKEKINSYLFGTSNIPEDVLSRLTFEYPYADDKSGLKISVSELKRRSMMVTDDDSREDNDTTTPLIVETEKIVPKFLKAEEKTYSPALRGTAIHRVFELWDYSLNTDSNSVSDFIEKVHNDKRLEADLYELVNARIVEKFVNSDVAERMKKADEKGLLRREQPFVIEDKETGMLIQGIIDAYFIEDNEIVVVDYKTDNVKSADELVKKYHIQLDYYATALNILTGMNVKEKVIYSTRLNECITM